MIKNLFLLAIVTLIAGCGDGSKLGQNDSKYTINGKPANEFYAQFTYAAEGDCNDVDTVHFRYLGSVEQLEVGRDVNGDPIVGRVELALMGDGSYAGTYIESVYVHSSGGITRIVRLSEKAISGRWSINGINLIVEHVGSGEGGEFNHEQVVHMAIQGAGLNRAADGHVTMLGLLYSNVSAQGESAADYCARVTAP